MEGSKEQTSIRDKHQLVNQLASSGVQNHKQRKSCEKESNDSNNNKKLKFGHSL